MRRPTASAKRSTPTPTSSSAPHSIPAWKARCGFRSWPPASTPPSRAAPFADRGRAQARRRGPRRDRCRRLDRNRSPRRGTSAVVLRRRDQRHRGRRRGAGREHLPVRGRGRRRSAGPGLPAAPAAGGGNAACRTGARHPCRSAGGLFRRAEGTGARHPVAGSGAKASGRGSARPRRTPVGSPARRPAAGKQAALRHQLADQPDDRAPCRTGPGAAPAASGSGAILPGTRCRSGTRARRDPRLLAPSGELSAGENNQEGPVSTGPFLFFCKPLMLDLQARHGPWHGGIRKCVFRPETILPPDFMC